MIYRQLNLWIKLSILKMRRGVNMDTDYYREIIKKYRNEKKLSQEQLSELLDCDPTYISRIEKGKRDPSIDFFIKFSNLSMISLDYLLCCETQIGAQLKINEYTRKIIKLSPKDRQFVFHLFDELITRLEQDNNE